MRFDYESDELNDQEINSTKWKIISDFILNTNKDEFHQNLATLNSNVYLKLKNIMESTKSKISRKKTLRK